MKNKDVKGHRECFHDDWQFVFHSSGKVMTRADDLPDEEFKEFMEVLVQEKHRCIYENDDILVTHSFNTYKSGDKEREWFGQKNLPNSIKDIKMASHLSLMKKTQY